MNNRQRSKYLVKNTALFALGNMGTKLISFFLVPIYTNVLSTAEYGTIDLVASICTVLVPILTFNIGEAVMRFALDEDANYDKVMSIGFIFGIASVLLGLWVTPLFSFFEATKSYCIYIYLYSITLGICQIANANLRGREKLLQYAISNILHSLSIALLNILFLVVFKEGIIGYFKAYILSNCITALYAFTFGGAIKSLFKFKFDYTLMKKMVAYSVVLIPNSFMWWIMNSSDRLMVAAMVNTEANGLYAISYKIPTLLSTFSIIFNQAWSYSALKVNTSCDKEEYNNMMYDQMAQTVIIITAALLMIMKPFLYFYVDASYYCAWKYTPYLMIGFTFMTLGTFLSTSYTVNKDSTGFLMSGTLGAGINIFLNFLLIPLLGVTGAAVATGISYFSVFVFRAVHTRKYVKINVLKKLHIIGYFGICIMGCTMFIDGYVGQILLIIEFLILAIVFKTYVSNMLKMLRMVTIKFFERFSISK